jgi:hypothetical protein
MARTTLVTIFCVMLASRSAWAQQDGSTKMLQDVPQGDVLQQILIELRSVRQSLDRSLLLQTQLLVWSEQVKLSYQMMTTKSDRLEGVRSQATLVHAEMLQATRNAEAFETQMNQAVDLDQKATFERQLAEQKSLMSECQQREAALREDETRLLREFQDAQIKMDQSTAGLQAVVGQVQQDAHKTPK